eukprot:3938128-Rhodomonas_salina.2
MFRGSASANTAATITPVEATRLRQSLCGWQGILDCHDHDITGEQINWSIPLRTPQFVAPPVQNAGPGLHAGQLAQQAVVVPTPAHGGLKQHQQYHEASTHKVT